MKRFIFYLIGIMTFMLFFSGCIVNIVGDASLTPGLTAGSILQIVAGSVVTLYELIVRIVPTVANYSVIGFVIDVLKKLSDFLNVSKDS